MKNEKWEMQMKNEKWPAQKLILHFSLFTLFTLFRNFDLRPKLLTLENTKEKQAFLLYFPRLFVTLHALLMSHHQKQKQT